MTRFNKVTKKDLNQDEIVKALENEGAVIKSVHSLKNLFDILVYYKGKTFSVEIKNGKYSKLSEGEEKCKNDIEKSGVKYWIIRTVDEAIKMINEK